MPSLCGQDEPRIPSDSVSPFWPASRQNGGVRRDELRRERMPLPVQRLEPGVGDPSTSMSRSGPTGTALTTAAAEDELAGLQLDRAAAGADLDVPHR